MTKETTDRIGASFFEALNKGGMVDKSITPINKTEANSVAEKVSSLEEGAPDMDVSLSQVKEVMVEQIQHLTVQVVRVQIMFQI